ncbi:hypothetical protein C8Q80DRAFT_1110638 [Daedaleopsis nitida]|nr:hypothetical protein C8Q80DRAFT_1110638 [Daedaleopsis nitida]
MASTSSFPPPPDLALERSSLVGALVGAMAYGVHTAIFVQCLYYIVPRNFTLKRGTITNWLLALYTCIMFAMGTLNFACNSKITELMFVDNREFPGGPMVWFFAHYNIGTNTAGHSALIIADSLATGLLLWRCYVIWNSVWVIVFPMLAFMATIALSILTLFQSSRPDASIWSSTTVQISLPYFSVAMSLNVLLTILLVGRLIYMSRQAKLTLGREHATMYNSIVAMLIESAVPFAVMGLAYIVAYARGNSEVQNVLLPIFAQVMCISPEVILLRVALNRSVTSRTATSGSTELSIKYRSGFTHRGSAYQFSTMSDYPNHPPPPWMSQSSTDYHTKRPRKA